MTQNTSLPAQKHLWSVKKHYDARLPEDVRLLPLPTGLSAQTAQLWLLENIIEPEQALEDDCRYDSPLGAVLWRKAFWKRVISLIEAEIAAGTDDELEMHEGLLFYLSSLMAVSATIAKPTYIRRFHYCLSDDVSSFNSVLTVEDEASISGGTTGLHTWPAALYLANHLIVASDLVASKNVLEIGSGSGMLAVLIRQLQQTGRGGSLVASDFHDAVLQRLQHNLQLNFQDKKGFTTASVQKLDWWNPSMPEALHSLDLIVASDVIYDPELAQPLASCIVYLLKANPHCSALLSQTVRNQATIKTFLEACSSHLLDVQEAEMLLPEEHVGVVTGRKISADIKLFRIDLLAEK